MCVDSNSCNDSALDSIWVLGGCVMGLTVEFEVLETKKIVAKTFANPQQCRNFINRLRHSKKCRLVSYPNFSYC